MPKKKTEPAYKTVETITLPDANRVNIPTAEYQSIMRKDEQETECKKCFLHSAVVNDVWLVVCKTGGCRKVLGRWLRPRDFLHRPQHAQNLLIP
ncbi:hypothetical protein [Desulfonatronum parangueonense]